MIKELQELKARTERDGEFKMPAEEIAYLEGIKTPADLPNFDKQNEYLVALAYDAAKALGLSDTQALIVTGEAPADHATVIKLHYHDGEYLSGYTLHGAEAKLMECIGLAKYISGWGYHVTDMVVDKLGTEFEYRAAYLLAQPALTAKAEWAQAEKQRIEAAFAEAQRTGRDVVIDSYTDQCDDPAEECDVDNVVVYATPSGTRRISRSHTW